MADLNNSQNNETNAQERENKREKVNMELYDWFQCLIVALLVAILLFIFVGRTINVEGISMQPTFLNHDRVIISNLFFTPDNGDIIVFHAPLERFEGTPLVKRIIATEGQEIDINFENGNVFIDGVLLDEPYINNATVDRYSFTGPMTIPEGFVFVMGDNRMNSTDSRSDAVGLVDTRYILGRVLFVMIPGVDSMMGSRDWSRVGIPG